MEGESGGMLGVLHPLTSKVMTNLRNGRRKVSELLAKLECGAYCQNLELSQFK